MPSSCPTHQQPTCFRWTHYPSNRSLAKYLLLPYNHGHAIMPLHLLGKKSWNVYNQDNIDRVRRDEAQAQTAEQDLERRRRENEATERLRVLRGELPHTRTTASTEIEPSSKLSEHPGSSNERKRKRDELEHDERSQHPGQEHRHARRSRSRDSNGQANVTTDSLDQISNMRFRDAAGRHPDSRQPWYSKPVASISTSTSTSTEDITSKEIIGRDVWGNEDAGRQARDQKRMDTSDPLLAMKRGVKELKKVEIQRSEWRRERERDLHEVEELARRERHKKRREEERYQDNRDGHRDKDGHRLRGHTRVDGSHRERNGRGHGNGHRKSDERGKSRSSRPNEDRDRY